MVVGYCRVCWDRTVATARPDHHTSMLNSVKETLKSVVLPVHCQFQVVKIGLLTTVYRPLVAWQQLTNVSLLRFNLLNKRLKRE
jgi:hypothetical protein